MSRGVIAAIVAVVIAAAIIVGLAANNNKSSPNDTNTTNPSSNNSGSNNNGNGNNTTQPTSTNKVSIANMAFSPADITVKKGTTVTWTNNDSVAHDIEETDGKKGPASGTLQSGQTYSFTYNETGSFNYHCSIHPSMTGAVTVTQ